MNSTLKAKWNKESLYALGALVGSYVVMVPSTRLYEMYGTSFSWATMHLIANAISWGLFGLAICFAAGAMVKTWGGRERGLGLALCVVFFVIGISAIALSMNEGPESANVPTDRTPFEYGETDYS